MNFKGLLITFMFLSCSGDTPTENRLLDYNEAKLIVNMLQLPVQVSYETINWRDYLTMTKTNTTLILRMKQDPVPVVTVHDFYFEMDDYIELPNIKYIYLDFDYDVQVTNSVHNAYKLEDKWLILRYKRPEDRIWKEIDKRDLTPLLDSPLPVKFSFKMRALSGIAGIRGQEINTVTVTIKRFGILGEF